MPPSTPVTTDYTVLLQLLGYFTSIAVAVIASNAAAKKSVGDIVNQNDKTIQQMLVKLDFLWDIYAKDAVREARKVKLVAENSPLATTDVWSGMMPADLLKKIDHLMKEVQKESTEDVIVRAVVAKYLDELYHVSIDNDISIQALLGALQIYTREKISEKAET